VRAERPQDAWFGRALAVVGIAILGGLGALLAGPSGALAGAVAGVLIGIGIVGRAEARTRRRRRLLATPFPRADRDFLLERYDHYERLSPALRRRFEDDLRVFLSETRITGVGSEASPELRLLVAASAVTLSLGWPAAEWDQLTEVLLYPDDFDRDYGAGHERAGEAHAWGTVILSVPTLLESFEHDRDGYHVGLHEFAHLLDVEQAEFDGMPGGLASGDRRAWAALVPAEIERIRARRSVLDDYGAEGPVEFFPVAVEAFFERPQALRRRHRELYELLARYFAQDPAAWDDERGLSG
jgi:Mlc titration factor MtfA (ptsG expression regulator)